MSYRAKTSIQQKLPAQLEKQLESFVKQVKELRKAHSFSPELIINMDETPLYFDMPVSRTINKRGARQIRVKSTGAEKRRFTVILACTASGKMLPPMMIFKGKRPLKKLRVPRGAVVMVQKKGWNDAPLTKVWIRKILTKHTQKRHALLVWDTFSGHMTEDVSALLSRSNVTSAVIPGGCTSKVQPLDVCLNKPFKGLFRNKWMDYMQQAVSQDEASCIKPATKQQIVEWVVLSSNYHS